MLFSFRRRELVEMRNQAEALVHSTERMLKDFGEKVPAADKATVETALADIAVAHGGKSGAEAKAAIDALRQAGRYQADVY